ncbi:MAG: rod shape-determining protein [Lachnospiraceae bacterium]|nr:rod shape-determining protein [Lachnospiraceae bacterium]
MAASVNYPGNLVFGLDIGTRSVVGTVGYRKNDIFYVVAQAVKEHETRAMVDGQIHDIGKVAGTIQEIKELLEDKIDRKLSEVCIAAAGRVLRTEYASVEIEFDREEVVTDEHIYELDAAGVEKAYETFIEHQKSDEKFYCVGHSVMHYYMNGNLISNLENHKANKIGMDLIATFLPSDVIDGLYSAVEIAGLKVANLTLEPIAAMEVAVPEKFRMLNIALVDVGAGTSDICITKDGCIAAYGMIPVAGDNLTDAITQHCLVEFNVAEQIKRGISEQDSVEYEDIMGLTQSITKEEVMELLQPIIDNMTTKVADMILSLNGDKPVSAVFVVGGGGKIEGYTTLLADKIGIPVQRVALRGEDVMQKISFQEDFVKRDSMLVTPLGICLNFYEQNNNFIFVSFNEERVKLYDNGKLSIVDAVMQAGMTNEDLFPKRGESLNFSVNGKSRVVRGNLGEAAEVYLNGETADLHTLLQANDVIKVVPSTPGEAASMMLSKIAEVTDTISVDIDGKNVKFPKFATVNGEFQTGSYAIKDGDAIELLNYYTVGQILEFLDVVLEDGQYVEVNNKKADEDVKVYDNFSFVIKNSEVSDSAQAESYEDLPDEDVVEEADTYENLADDNQEESVEEASVEKKHEQDNKTVFTQEITVIVNKMPITLQGKDSYIYVDVFDYIDFDLGKGNGRAIVTNLNDKPAQYMEELKAGDVIEIYWKEKDE